MAVGRERRQTAERFPAMVTGEAPREASGRAEGWGSMSQRSRQLAERKEGNLPL